MLDNWPALFGAGAEGSRAMLTAIAGSMITVAGVAFFITLVTLSLASILEWITAESCRSLDNWAFDDDESSVEGASLPSWAQAVVAWRTGCVAPLGYVVSIDFGRLVYGGIALLGAAVAVVIVFPNFTPTGLLTRRSSDPTMAGESWCRSAARSRKSCWSIPQPWHRAAVPDAAHSCVAAP